MNSSLVLTGSRGVPIDIDVPLDLPCVRVQQRALPLSFIQDLHKAHPALRHIVAIGGGTVMDAAKALFSLQGRAEETRLDLVPTTFGTGAEITRFATVYDGDGYKRSLVLPDSTRVHVNYRSEQLRTLPDLEMRAGFCDAFAHGFESLWAVQSTPQSREYATAALRLSEQILREWGSRTEDHYRNLQTLGHLAGQAIAISKSTAAHALSYEWTQRWGIPHGFAVVVSLPALHALVCENMPEHPALGLQAQSLNLASQSEVHRYLLQLIHRLIPADVGQSLSSIMQQGRRQKPCAERLGNFPVAIDRTLLAQIDRDSNTNSGLVFITEQECGTGNAMRSAPPAEPMDFTRT